MLVDKALNTKTAGNGAMSMGLAVTGISKLHMIVQGGVVRI